MVYFGFDFVAILFQSTVWAAKIDHLAGWVEKEIELKFDLERNVKLVSFNKGKIDISFNEKLNKNFIKNLTEKLLSWTGERWIISLSKNSDAKSIYEKNLENKSNMLEDFKKSKTAKDIKKAFPDAQLIDLKNED